VERVAILGSTGTIGRTLAASLVARGDEVLLLGRNADKLAALAGELRQPWAVCDCSQSESLRSAIAESMSDAPLSGLVNCVGSLLLKPAHATSDEDFRQCIETNLFSAFATVRAAGLLMRARGGSVVLIASAAAHHGLQNHEAISAAKAGIVGLARSAAATYANANIRFNVVSPGLTRTELTRRIWDNPTSAAASLEMHPLGRLGEAHHVVSACAWLLDPANDFTTGQVLQVDGGLANVAPKRRG